MSALFLPPDPIRDLVLERIVDLPPEELFAGWTTPELLVQWFCPAPWETIAAEVELRPGGIFATTMRSPEGQTFPGVGCVLDVVPGRRFAWTGALGPGFRPHTREEMERQPFTFSAVVTFEPHGTGTRYVATVIHADAAGRDAHETMGFHAGWNAALDQLIALVRRRRGEGATPAGAAG